MSFLFASALVFIFWIPILWHFLRQWLRRKNPISLAICAIVLLVIYSGLMRPFERSADPDVVLWTMLAANVATVAYFYASYWWAKKKFKSERRSVSSVEKGN